MKYVATKVARTPFSREFEAADAGEAFIKAEEDWHATGGKDWSMGGVTFDPITLDTAAKVTARKNKPTRERTWATS